MIRNTRARQPAYVLPFRNSFNSELFRKLSAWQAASNEVKPDITRTCYRLPLPELLLLLSINYYAFIRIFNDNIHIKNMRILCLIEENTKQ